jgi:hypothetical protein
MTKCQGHKKPQEQRLKERFKSNFQIRNKIRLCDSKTITQVFGVEQRRGGNFTSIYTLWAFNSKKFFKKLLIYMWPMFTHVCQCAPMCEL